MRVGIEGEEAPDISSEEFEHLRNVYQEKPKNKHDTQPDRSWGALQNRALDWLGERTFGSWRKKDPQISDTSNELDRDIDNIIKHPLG